MSCVPLLSAALLTQERVEGNQRFKRGSWTLQPALGELLSQGDDALRVQNELLLLRREIEGLDVEEARVGGCDLVDQSGDIDLVDPLVVGRRLLADVPLQLG